MSENTGIELEGVDLLGGGIRFGLGWVGAYAQAGKQAFFGADRVGENRQARTFKLFISPGAIAGYRKQSDVDVITRH